MEQARLRRYLSSDHFSVDGTVLEAWASHKSFKPKDRDPNEPPPAGRNSEQDFHGEQRSNTTHQSTTDPEARLYRKSAAAPAKMAYLGHVLMEHRNALIVDADLIRTLPGIASQQRIELMRDENVAETVADMRHEIVEQLVAKHIPEKAYPEQWDAKGLHEAVRETLNLDLPVEAWAKEEGIADDEVRERIVRTADEQAAQRAVRFTPEIMRQVEKAVAAVAAVNPGSRSSDFFSTGSAALRWRCRA